MFHTLAKVDDYICGHWAHGVHKMAMWTGAEHRLNKPQYTVCSDSSFGVVIKCHCSQAVIYDAICS